MSEQSKNQASPNAQHNEQDLISLIKKLQEHLVILLIIMQFARQELLR